MLVLRLADQAQTDQKHLFDGQSSAPVAVLSSSEEFPSSSSDAFGTSPATSEGFSFVHAGQALAVLKAFPGHQQSPVGSFVLLVAARLTARLKHQVSALDEQECRQAMDAQVGLRGFRLYSVVLPGRTLAVSHRIESCDRSTGSFGKVSITYEDGSTEIAISEDLLPEYDYGLILELYQHPMADKMHVNYELIRYSQGSSPQMLVRKRQLSFDSKMDESFKIKHGIGNIEGQTFDQPLISIFEYFYHSLAIADGGFVRSLAFDCDWDSAAQGGSLYAIDGILEKSSTSPVTLTAIAGPAVLCSEANSHIAYSGCQTRLTVAGDRCVERSVSTGKCTMCSSGYFIKDQAECAECGFGCHNCQNSSSCEVCKRGFAKRQDLSGQYVCFEVTSDDSNIYLPQLQAVFTSSLLQSNSFSLDSRSIVIIEAEVALEFTDDFRMDSYSFYQASFALDGLVMQTRQLTEPATQTPSVCHFHILAELDAGEHKTSVLSIISWKLSWLRIATMPVKPEIPCLVKVWDSCCHLCNYLAGYYLNSSQQCSSLEQSTFVSERRPGIGDSLAACYNPESTLRCFGSGGSQALECKPGYFLQAAQDGLSTGLNCAACSCSCISCSSTANNCTACADGLVSLTIFDADLQALTTACLLRCPEGYFLSSQDRSCQKCPPNCSSCSQSSTIGCLTCLSGFQLYQDGSSHFGICAEPCSIPNCSSCLRPNVCGSCITGYQLDKVSSRCDRIPPLVVSIEAKLNIQQRSLNLLFEPAVLPRDVKDSITIKFDPEQMELGDGCFNQTTPTKNCEFQLRIKQEDAIQNLKLEITIASTSNLSLGSEFHLMDQTIKIMVPYKGLSSMHNLRVFELMTSVLSYLTQSCAFFSLFTEPSTFVSIVRSNQLLKILLIVSDVIPSNAAEVVAGLSSGLLDNIYNPFKNIGSVDCSLPIEYEKIQIKCGLLQSIGHVSLVIVALLLLKVSSLILSWQKCIKFKKILWLDNLINGRNFVDWALIVADGFLVDMLMASLVNVKYFRSSGRVYPLVNLLLSIIVLFYSFTDVLLVYFVTYPKHLQLFGGNPPQRKSVRFELEGEGQSPGPFIPSVFGVPSKYLASRGISRSAESGNPAILLQKSKAVLQGCLAVLLSRWRLVQTVLIAAIQLSFALLFTIKMPHDTKKENFKTLSTEILLSVTMMLCVALVNNPALIDSAHDRYYYVGFALASAVSSVFALAAAAWIYSSVEGVLRVWKTRCRKKETRRGKLLRSVGQSKVLPTPQVPAAPHIKVLKLAGQLALDSPQLAGPRSPAFAAGIEEAPLRASQRLPVRLFDGRLSPVKQRPGRA